MLASDISCDVAVVGAGVSGALTAHRLARAGLDVVVLDRAVPGSGSTAACTALIQYDLDQPMIELERIHDSATASDAFSACHRALFDLEQHVSTLDDDCALAIRPSLLLARKRRDVASLREEMSKRKSIGIDVRLADRDELLSTWNIDREAAIVSNRSIELDPYRLTAATLRAARSLGARVFAPAEVLWESLPEATHIGERLELETTHGPRVRAREIVVATGYQTPAAVRKYYGSLHSTWAACSKPLANLDSIWPQRELIWEWGSAYLYARTRPDGSVIFGGRDRRFRNPDLRDALTDRTIRQLITDMSKLKPGLTLEPAYKWCGTFGETRDGMPYVGRLPGHDHVHFALGFGGNGVTFSVLAAQIITDTIRGSCESARLVELFRFDR